MGPQMNLNKKRGFIIRGFDFHTGAETAPFFRVYNEDKSFTDYDIAIHDLEVEICDPNNFYTIREREGKRKYLDYSDKVLGK